MNFNSGNIGREEECLNITNINLLNIFNKTREIFPSVTQVSVILPKVAATCTSVGRVHSKERVPNVPCLILAASYGEI